MPPLRKSLFSQLPLVFPDFFRGFHVGLMGEAQGVPRG
jgi:hypothetical protein